MPRNNQTARQLMLAIEPEPESAVVMVCPACGFRLCVERWDCPRCRAQLQVKGKR